MSQAAVMQPGPCPNLVEVLAHPLSRAIYARSITYWAKFGRPMPAHEIAKVETAFLKTFPGNQIECPEFDQVDPMRSDPLKTRWWGIWNNEGDHWAGPEYYPLKSIAENNLTDMVLGGGFDCSALEVREYPADNPLE